MSLEQQLTQLVEEHELVAIGLHIHRSADGTVYFTVDVHDGNLCGLSAFVTGRDVTDQFLDALASLDAKRGSGRRAA